MVKVTLLLEAKADTDLTDGFGRTALRCASMEGYLKVAGLASSPPPPRSFRVGLGLVQGRFRGHIASFTAWTCWHSAN